MTPWTVAHQAPLSMGFSRQEYWSGLLFPSPGNLPDPGIEPGSPALQADSLLTGPPGKTSLQKGCINLFYSRVGRDKLSLLELNKGTLVYSQAEGQGPPGKPVCMIVIIKTSQGNKFPAWRQNWLPPCNIVISFPTESEDRDLGDLSEVVRILSFCQGSQHLLTAAA